MKNRSRMVLLVIVVVLAGCSRREKLHYPKQSAVWPRYDLKVQLSLRSKLPQALSRPPSERAKSLASVVETARVMVGRPELSRADRQRLVDVCLLAAEGVGLTGYVSPGFTGGKPVPLESLARRWRDYAQANSELQTWLESEAQRSESSTAKLAEALLAAFDQYMRWRLQKLREGRPKEELIQHRVWSGGKSVYWRPEGERGDALRDAVLLYVAVTRPNRQLVENLDDLAWNFELELDEWDAARTLARLGQPDLVKRVLGRALNKPPRDWYDLERRQRLAYAFWRGVKTDQKAAGEVLDAMMTSARGEMQVQACLTAAEAQEKMRSASGAVRAYRRAYEFAPKDPRAFGGMLKAVDLEAFKLDAAEAALQHAQRLVEDSPDDRGKAEARLLVARVLAEKLKRPREAVGVYETLRDGQPGSEFAAAVMLLAMNALYKAAEYDRVHSLAALNEALFAKHQKAPHAALMVALAYLGEMKYEDARQRLRALLAGQPGPDLAARAQFLIGYSHLVTQEYSQACDAFEQLVRNYPTSTWADTASKQYLPRLRQFKGQTPSSPTESPADSAKP